MTGWSPVTCTTRSWARLRPPAQPRARCGPQAARSRRRGAGRRPQFAAGLSAGFGEAHQVVGADLGAQPVQVAVGDGIEDAAVPLRGLGQADALTLDLGPHHRAHLAVQHQPQVLEPAATGDVDQQLVELRVRGHQRVHVIGLRRHRHVLKRQAQVPGQIAATRPQPRFEARLLQDVPGVADVLSVLLRHPRHHAVPAGNDVDQALGLQAAHGVADGRPADAELGGEIRLDEARLGREFVVEDAVTQRPAHRLRQ